MSIYDDYNSREELLGALESAITKREDGKWRLADDEREALTKRCETFSRNAAQYQRRGEELESQLARAERERATAVAELERLRGVGTDGNDLNAALRRYAEQASASESKAAALEAELAPLREENARYKERETRRTIEAQLVDEARKLDCCESALRDVKRLAPIFKLDEAGVAVAEDARRVAEVLRDEIALSPHWLSRSRGSGASPGAERDAYGASERFQDAMRRGDFADVIRYAPRG
ncbi:MAG: hypothetical protein ACOX0A_07145 [Thermoguttaceae bacterium]